MPIETLLKEFGLSEKAIIVYLALLKKGPSSVRGLSIYSSLNRGTTYNILKELQDYGLVAYYHKEKKQYFTAEDPEKIKVLIKRRQEDFAKNCRKIIDIIPELKSLYNKGGEKPVVRFYEGYKGITSILTDVLNHCDDYYVYSAETIRSYLYKEYPNFTEDRIKKNIMVKVIAIGKGGEKRGLDERKWLSYEETAPTYTIIYKNRLAMISINVVQEPIGIIIEDQGIYQTQKLIFESLWERL